MLPGTRLLALQLDRQLSNTTMMQHSGMKGTRQLLTPPVSRQMVSMHRSDFSRTSRSPWSSSFPMHALAAASRLLRRSTLRDTRHFSSKCAFVFSFLSHG